MSEVQEKVILITADITGHDPERIKSTETFANLGVDSLDIIDLAMSFEQEFGVRLEEKDVNLNTTIERVVEIIEERI